MEFEDLDEEMQERIRYRLLLAKFSSDDPVTYSYMLKRVSDLFAKENVKMPEKIETFIRNEATKIYNRLLPEYKAKQEMFESLIERSKPVQKEAKKRSPINKTKDIFSGSSFGQ